jgi:hypothetical protein
MVPVDDPRASFYKGMFTVLGQVYTRSMGRLGFKEEAAGKVRVFAMVDPFTQWAMKPLHEDIFELLALMPEDGTKDQLAPVRRLVKRNPKGPFFSFDLTAATDRLPIIIQMVILAKFLTARGADLWATLLVGRKYDYVYKPKVGKTQTGTVVYEAGQPMGALSSWAMLALTHHAIVQMAAFNAGVIKPGKWFTDYALLGDDIVIANHAVAKEYLVLMAALGVDIGLAKSLISLDGQTLEFAKRTIHLGQDVSPVPFSEYWVGRQQLAASLELVIKYSLSLTGYLDLFGFGYRAKGSVTGNLMSLGQRLRHRVLAYFSPLGPNPLSIKDFFSLKGLGRLYKATDRKILDLTKTFVTTELQRILDTLNGDSIKKLEGFVTLLSTVNKDREYYGTVKRSFPNARKIDLADLHPDRPTALLRDEATGELYTKTVDKDIFYFVVDDIVQTVYRETYLDVRSELREMRYAVEDAIKAKSGPTLDDLDVVVRLYFKFQRSIAEIPLPKEIYKRVDSEAQIKNLELIKQWEVYSRFLRSTVSE